MGKPTPVLFFSHGSTMMLGEQSVVSRDWQEAGRQAELAGVKGIVLMGAHWETAGRNVVRVSTRKAPGFVAASWVHPKKFQNWTVNCDADLAHQVMRRLRAGGVEVIEDSKSNWIHDTMIPLKWMFPHGTPPCTQISLNTKYEPSFHSYVGKLLGPLRDERILIVGSGGAVHNLYRNYWPQVVFYRNPYAQENPPSQGMVEFRSALYDVMTKRRNGDDDGEDLRLGVTRLMHHPFFRNAHGTDDHFMAACFVAGAARKGDAGMKTSEVWEMQNMCNTQFILGSW